MTQIEARAEAEARALELIAGGATWFDPYVTLTLWLACERLVKAGNLKRGPIANSYKLP